MLKSETFNRAKDLANHLTDIYKNDREEMITETLQMLKDVKLI